VKGSSGLEASTDSIFALEERANVGVPKNYAGAEIVI